jgi:hypothetical protein
MPNNIKIKYNYTEKEIELFNSINPYYIKICAEIPPPRLYEILTVEAFCKNLQGNNINSLRKCMSALKDSTVYRNTKEWDNLIQL